MLTITQEKEGRDFDSLSRREWLTVNGTGSYAMGTVAGSNSRRYHGYLVAALPAPYGRMTLLGKVEETIHVARAETKRPSVVRFTHEVFSSGEDAYSLSSNRYPGSTIHPDGWHRLLRYENEPVPTWIFALPDGATVEKRVFLGRGENTVYVTYRYVPAVSEAAPARLTLTPLIAWKTYHAEMHPFPAFPHRSESLENQWCVQATPDAPVLLLSSMQGTWKHAHWWNSNMLHEREQERGFDHYEDLYCPATCELTLPPHQTVTFVATIEHSAPRPAEIALQEIIARQQELFHRAQATTETGRTLLLNADQFIVFAPAPAGEAQHARPGKTSDTRRATILAGYPWFTDWGRDTMISLPGLCLATERPEIAHQILTDFALYLSQGMIPNRFPDAGAEPEYNTVDATLWFVQACYAYTLATGDKTFQKAMVSIVEDIITAHRNGTRYGIVVDPSDILLSAGEEGSQLTWMDAKVGDWPVTPRIGKPVEINALWINALRVTAAWKGPRWGKPYRDAATKAIESFRTRFVRPDGLGLYDVIKPDGTPDTAIRPNQIIAAALPFSPLTVEEIQTVVAVVEAELLTPYGLRTLAPSDPHYRGRYEGGPAERDGAYHQGTVWPFLLGPFLTAYRKVHGANADVSRFVASLLDDLTNYGVGGVAEVYDGDGPQRPNGCPFQAWSIAALLESGIGK